MDPLSPIPLISLHKESKMIVRFCLFSLGGILFTFMPSTPRILVGICERVWDGDTLRVDGKVIRLAHIDAPELKQRSQWGIPIGKQSAQFLSHLTLHRVLSVELLGQEYLWEVAGKSLCEGEGGESGNGPSGPCFCLFLEEKTSGSFLGGTGAGQGQKTGVLALSRGAISLALSSSKKEFSRRKEVTRFIGCEGPSFLR